MSVVLGLDPGSIKLGYGVVESRAGRLQHLAHGTLTAPRSLTLPRRLARLFDQLTAVLDEHPPDAVGLERVFTARNPAAALTLGQARGMILLAMGQRDLEVAEYAPGEVKLAVGGSGRSSKEQVAALVARLLGVKLAEATADSTDALAIAICHAESLSRRRLLERAARHR
jgi:crossover junction endodeoxyribonuclease RuvC